ncbi:hypothetical protein B0G57_12315 [Trinickia symbiotica]|uniref:hypothetical protein n=1 Tax=Trinickia symbiotica TaxID=863227 RepID=UPI00039EF86A|nr:hypothetical protein [Trinickia symbiotica]PPK41920.1 hypothetical protein B0G57_12315 [Trinickia symbiotica]
MDTRHTRTFLMISAAFFAMNMPVRATSAATPSRLAAAVSHTARMASAGVGGELEAAKP